MTRQAAAPINPWGTLGNTVTTKFAPVEQVMREHGLDWEVNLEPMFLADGTLVDNNFVTRRSTDGAILGVVGDRYKPVQNIAAFKFFNSFVESKQASISTVGSFKGGRVLFIQAKVEMDPVEVVKGHPMNSYITMGHAHDGSKGVLCGFTPVEMFCINQMPMLKKSSSSKLLSMKHTKNVVIGLEAIKGIMDIHRAELNATVEQYKFLASKGINRKTLEKCVTLIFSKEGKEPQDKTMIVEKIAHLYENGRGLGGSEMQNYYGLFNAITEHLTWDAGRTIDNRLTSLWWGENQALEQKAFQICLDMASGKQIKAARS